MRVSKLLKQLAIFFTAVCTSALSASAQQPQNQNPDVIKVTTSLVQTDVMVFDKQGKFVDDLKREQFVLKVDGKPREISFFERVQAGSSTEEAQLAAARGAAANAGAPVPLDRGRLIFFFIDDLHLSAGSFHHVRTLLSRFVERELGQNDRVAIVSASGQIGFLQQLTGNHTVLRKAIDRLKPNLRSTKDFDRPPMSEHQAELIERRDVDVTNYFIEFLIREDVPRQVAAEMVRQRAKTMLEQSAHFSIISLETLQRIVRSAADLPGRKLVFFISDGFSVTARDTVRHRVRDVTTQAARNAAVIYSIDARGLVASVADPTEPVAFDPTGRLQRATSGELTASQDGMNALAVDTGGRALFNSNDLFQSVKTGLRETSRYYLLAWRPDSQEENARKDRRLEVTIVGRPEWKVRFRRNFSDAEGPDERRKEKSTPTTTSANLREALRADDPKTGLPVHAVTNFLNLPDRGSVLAFSIRISTAQIPLEIANASGTAQIDLALVVLDDRGNSVKSVSRTLNLRSVFTSANTNPPGYVVYSDYSPIKPGLYQIRAAVLERKGGRLGSVNQWIEIPDLDSKRLAMSSLIVAEKSFPANAMDVSGDDAKQEADADPFKNLQLSIERRFTRDSHLRFLTFVYNAASGGPQGSGVASSTPPAGALRSPTAPDLAIQVQVFRDGQPVITTPMGKIQTDGASDLMRLPYAADISLEGLQSGNYVLQVRVIDRVAKTSASEQFKFQVD